MPLGLLGKYHSDYLVYPQVSYRVPTGNQCRKFVIMEDLLTPLCQKRFVDSTLPKLTNAELEQELVASNAKINDMERQMQGMNINMRTQSQKMDQARRLLMQ